MSVRVIITILLFLFNTVNCNVFGGNRVVYVSDITSLSALEHQQSVNCYIIKEIDLKGRTIRLPAESYIRIKKGGLKNGIVILDNATLKCKKGSFVDVLLRGTIKNNSFYSSWLKLTGDYSDLYVDALRLACNSNADFVFTKGTYRFRTPLFLYNKTNLKGKGRVILIPEIVSPDNKPISFIIAGNESLNTDEHVRGIKWVGNIHDLTILINEGQKDGLDAVIGLYNASNCSIYRCKIDASHLSVPIAHIIGAFNNARFANPSGGQNIHIYDNSIICQGSLDYVYSISGQLLSCESIGVGNRKDVTIENNVIINASDDLGIHTCENVKILNNNIKALDGRIYVSGTQGCVIRNNRLSYVSPVQSGMGIKITIEQPYQQPNKRIEIINNVVDYSGASMDPNYGIWAQGQDVLIEKNTLISNGASNARIWLDVIKIDNNQDERKNNFGVLVPDNIIVRDNKAKSFYCVADTKYDVKEWIISNNSFESDWFVCNRKEATLEGNTTK